MIPALASAVVPLLRQIDAERAHRLTLTALRLGLAGRVRTVDDPRLHVRAFGLDFRNPIGLAAGFDKDATALRGLTKLGFGFIEAGTVTPLPQPGNPPPRLFRLRADDAIINRMGFNNRGFDAFLAELARLAVRAVPIGANLGINKEGADPERDFPAMVAAVAGRVDYTVINVSSPNTPGLRDLQQEARLRGILQAVRARTAARPPLLVKLAPDLSLDALEPVIETCVEQAVDGLIVSNTTITRSPTLISPARREAGGLSGKPLFALSTALLARCFQQARGRLALIGVGGVRSGADALTKLRAGASLVQLYTEFAYRGPTSIARVLGELTNELHRAGFASVGEAVGSDAERLARLV